MRRMARFGFLSTYPPTRCGLATFTAALAAHLTGPDDESIIVRVDDLVPAGPSDFEPRIRVAGVLRPADAPGRDRAVALLDGCDVAIIQHEYGIYGGPDGDEIVDLLDRVRVPVIVVLHTVLARPTAHQRTVTTAIAARAGVVVAMTDAARRLLVEVYEIDADRIRVIPHGADPWVDAPTPRGTRPVVLTWGLLGPGKGIEWGIRAMAEFADTGHAPLYRVLGQTHPKVVRDSGNSYRQFLRAEIAHLGVEGAVDLDGRYRETPELARDVASADVVLLPYDTREQTTSGVLAEAVAAGKPVIATRFPHAVEVLSDGAGVLVDHQNPTQIASALRHLLAQPERAAAMRERAREVARTNGWDAVAEQYRAVALDALDASVVR
jgi:glycosyltransferase involved in cell wall biosynthesis